MKKPRKLRKQTTFREDVGKLLLDFGKLVFGSMFLGGIIRGELSQSMLIESGFLAAIVLCSVGLWAVSKEKKNEENIDSST